MHQALLVSLDLQEESDLQAPLVQLENQDPWDPREKRDLVDFVVIMDPLEDKANVDLQDHQAARETKGTLERTAQRVLMVLQAQLELQDREALWVFLVREESVGCQVSQDQRVHQENRDPQDQLEIKALQVQWVYLVLTDLVVILVLMVPQDLTAPQERTVFWDKGETEEILVLRAWLVLRDFLDLLVLLVHQVMLEKEESLAQEDLQVHLVQLERED